jgi:4-hydroxythreonine-4-phosphate dehydrogenase
VLVGESRTWQRAAALRGVSISGIELVEASDELDAIALGVRGCLDGHWDALCTMPIHKADLQARGFAHSGHTPYLAELCGRPQEDAVMVFAGGTLAVSLATVHIPLKDVPGALDGAAIGRAARGLAWALTQLGGTKLRLAVCGLNPHAGEGGTLGTEDRDVVAPAVAALRAEGLDIAGPFPADTLFARAAGGEFDGVVALFHDQGLIPVKTLDFGRSVNITAGLPLVRTSVDHGTARDIAWTGRAEARHAVAALRMAAALSRGRPGS